MTYEEKLSIVFEAINEARQFTRKNNHTKLHLGTGNSLTRIPLVQLHDILLQLQDDEKIIIIKDIPSVLKSSLEQSIDEMEVKKNYFLLNILDNFNNWYENRLIQQKSKPEKLDWLNLLKVLDICSDINQKIQITRNTTLTIPSFPYPYIGRFLELFPYDSIGTRKSYQQYRWEGAKYLLKEGVALEANYDRDNMLGYGNIMIKINLIKFDDFYKLIRSEFEKRKKSFDQTRKSPKTIKKTTVRLKVTYNAQKGELDIEGKKVRFKKDSFRAKLLELLLKTDKSRKKEWSWDEVIEKIEDIKDLVMLKKFKDKFYSACDGLSKHIASKTGVTDLLIFNKSTVQINPKYL